MTSLPRDDRECKQAVMVAQFRRDVFTAWAWTAPQAAVESLVAEWAAEGLGAA